MNNEKIFTKVIGGESVKCIVLDDNKYKICVKDKETVVDDPGKITGVVTGIINKCKLIDDGWVELQPRHELKLDLDVKKVEKHENEHDLEPLKEKLKVMTMDILLNVGKEGMYKHELTDLLKGAKIGKQADVVKISKETLDNLAEGKLLFFKHERRIGRGQTKILVYPIIPRMSDWQKLHNDKMGMTLVPKLFKGMERVSKINVLNDEDVQKGNISISEHCAVGTGRHFDSGSHPLRHN